MDTPASLYRDDYIECDRHGLTIHHCCTNVKQAV